MLLLTLTSALAQTPVGLALDVAAPASLRSDLRAQVVAHGPRTGPGGLGERGATVRLTRELQGLPVDVSGAVWLRPDGTVRAVRPMPVLPVRSGGVPLGLAEVLARAEARVAGAEPRSRLSWQAVGGALRRVWTVTYERSADPRFTVPVVRIDAVTGAVLSVHEGAQHVDAVARVYPLNPVLDGEPVEVSFSLPDTALADDRLQMLQCADLGEVVTYLIDETSWDYRLCTEVPAAQAKGGEYLYDEVPYPEDPARDEDAFVLPNLYWNVSKGLDWFTDLGWEPLPDFDPYLFVTANRRVTDTLTVQSAGDPDHPLYPYDNAYSTGGYLDWEDEWVAPRLVFGQGREVDYGYDADVIHHELAHYIVKSQAGPSWSPSNGYGTSVEARALNEGLADYFSSAIQGDPLLAEYAAGTERDHIRDLGADATCMADLYGESHYDGQPFAQGLWSVRETLDADGARLLDQTVLDSLTVMGTSPRFADAYEVITAGVDDTLGPDVGEALREAWHARGLPDCEPVLWVEASPDEPFRSYATVPYFSSWAYDNMLPGGMQYVVEVAEAGSTVTLRAVQAEYLGIDPYGTNDPVPPLVVGGPGQSIHWEREDVTSTMTYAGYDFDVVLERWIPDAEVLGTMTRVASAPHPDLPERYVMHDVELTFTVEEAGPLVVQFANQDDGYDITLYDLGVTVQPPPPEPSTAPDPTTPSPDPTTDVRLADDGPVEEEAAMACGCAASGGATGSGMLGLGLIMVVVRRRRCASSLE